MLFIDIIDLVEERGKSNAVRIARIKPKAISSAVEQIAFSHTLIEKTNKIILKN